MEGKNPIGMCLKERSRGILNVQMSLKTVVGTKTTSLVQKSLPFTL